MSDIHIFVFINARSGGKLGEEYLAIRTPGNPYINLNVDGNSCRVYLYNIEEGRSGEKPGFQKLSQHVKVAPTPAWKTQNPGNTTLCICAGGDGTVTWVLSELVTHEIAIDAVAIGIIPFGTGNDFSRALGWGGSPPRNLIGVNHIGLKQQIQLWLNATVVDYDLWSVKVQTHADGKFEFVGDDGKKGLSDSKIATNQIVFDDETREMKMTKVMGNYFSFGFAERAGLGMEKNRTSSTFGNLVTYATEGFKKTLFRRPPVIPDVVDSIAIETTEEEFYDTISIPGERRISVTFDEAGVWSKAVNKDISLKGNPIELIFLNIPSYGRGADLWKSAKRNGLTEKEILKYLQSFNQAIGDKQISVVSYTSTLLFQLDMVKSTFGCLKTLKDAARRVYQGPGPIHINFKPVSEAKYKREGRVYMQIDGEFFICNYPRSVTIRYSRNIRVLTSETPYTKLMICC